LQWSTVCGGRTSGHRAAVRVPVALMASSGVGTYAVMMSATLLDVPKISARMPTQISTALRMVIQTVTLSQYVANSMIIGTMMPSSEKQKAPMSPMNGPIVGTATAIATAKRQKCVIVVVVVKI